MPATGRDIFSDGLFGCLSVEYDNIGRITGANP